MATIVQRKGKDGKVSYQVKVGIKGHPPQTETFDRKTRATEWAEST